MYVRLFFAELKTEAISKLNNFGFTRCCRLDCIVTLNVFLELKSSK